MIMVVVARISCFPSAILTCPAGEGGAGRSFELAFLLFSCPCVSGIARGRLLAIKIFAVIFFVFSYNFRWDAFLFVCLFVNRNTSFFAFLIFNNNNKKVKLLRRRTNYCSVTSLIETAVVKNKLSAQIPERV